jgi:hypothetical protein
MSTIAYDPTKPPPRESTDELRARIPGWGADLDPADRPAVPREHVDPGLTHEHWRVPAEQPQAWPRERSIEHGQLPPVFGTSCPPHGLSGAVRRLAYRRFSEGRAAHWLLLLAADRVDVVESVTSSLLHGRPENPLVGSGLRAELHYDGLASRRGRGRADVTHQVLDPLVVAGPWLLGGFLAVLAVRGAVRGTRAAVSLLPVGQSEAGSRST